MSNISSYLDSLNKEMDRKAAINSLKELKDLQVNLLRSEFKDSREAGIQMIGMIESIARFING